MRTRVSQVVSNISARAEGCCLPLSLPIPCLMTCSRHALQVHSESVLVKSREHGTSMYKLSSTQAAVSRLADRTVAELALPSLQGDIPLLTALELEPVDRFQQQKVEWSCVAGDCLVLASACKLPHVSKVSIGREEA